MDAKVGSTLSRGGAANSARDAATQGEDLGFRVVAFLLEHQLSTAPMNYAVAHAHLEGKHPVLSAVIDARVAADKPLDAFLFSELYEEHLASESIRKVQGMGGDVERLLGGLIEDLRQADQGANAFHASLEENIELISDTPEDLEKVAQSLFDAALKARANNAELQENLALANAEARRLRDELEAHRVETMTDPLTGLLNRRGMEIEMGRVLADTDARPACMLVLDIDHFKRINDTYGHSVGDVVIRKVAQTVKSLAPGGAVPVRYGGEEFAILLPRANQDQAQAVAEKIRQTVEKLRLIRRQDQLAIGQFTLSGGVAVRVDDEDLDALFHRADNALYQAKMSGRNRIVLAR